MAHAGTVNPHGQPNPVEGEVRVQIMDADHTADAFWNLGFVTHEAPPQALYASLPDGSCGYDADGRSLHDQHCYVADLVDADGSTLDSREVTEELAQTLLDEPIPVLRERFRTWLWETHGATG